MWNLDDGSVYFRLPEISIPLAFTWGGNDRRKRELVRDAAWRVFPRPIPIAQSWAFRLFVRRPDTFDVDNVPKIIVDAFSADQLQRDDSQYLPIRLYDDDNVRHVPMVQVAGESSDGEILTRIEVFGRRLN